MSRRILLVASAAYAAAQLSSNNEPCAIAAAGLARSTVIPAEVAFECLNSVPVDVQGNSQLIDELKTVWQWQSELEWLKNPGQDWEYGPLDIEAELDDIKGKLSSFQSEYAVQLAIQNITVRTGNYHFNYAPDILQVFGFQRGLGIASISSDGQSLPKIYVYEDALALAAGASDVSDITEINGQSVYEYLVDNAYSQYIDSDGRLNKQFTHGDTNNPGAFDEQEIYQGAETAFTWSNGSSATITNIARTNQDFSLIADGESFFRAFCTGMISGASSSADTTKTRSSISPGLLGPVPRIPHGISHRTKRQTIPGQYASNPVTQSSSGVVEGFFLDGNGFSDVAVLKIISFSNPDSSDDEAFTKDFQATIASFLRQSVSEGKSKLVIDLRENGGGSVDLLLDAFMQIFPGKEPFSGQRYRATDTFNKIGDIVNELYTDPAKSRSLMNTFGVGIEEVSRLRFWLWWHFRTAEGENFSGWDQFNGPLNLNNDKLTTTMRYNYSNSDQVSIRSEGFSFTTNPPASPFDPSNIVMFTDALCGSSCASFHEELKNIAGIRSVTVGGRPRTGPIQAVAGTKGGEVAPLVSFTRMASLALNISGEIDLKTVKANDASLIAMANVPAIYTRAGDSMSRAQSQDQVRKGDKSATPLQFIYEAADCRIFYTPESFADPDQAWKQAWSAFQDDSKCVEGSTKHKSSISGGFKPYGAGELKAEDQPDASGSGDKDNAASGLRIGAWGVVVGVMGLMAML